MEADGTADENRVNPEQKIDFVPQADSISIETVINLLVQKGICTTEELFILEGKIRDKNSQEDQTQYIRIKNNTKKTPASQNMRWLKRKFSKHRWTRRLGTQLFGWRWRKVKRAQHDLPFNTED